MRQYNGRDQNRIGIEIIHRNKRPKQNSWDYSCTTGQFFFFLTITHRFFIFIVVNFVFIFFSHAHLKTRPCVFYQFLFQHFLQSIESHYNMLIQFIDLLLLVFHFYFFFLFIVPSYFKVFKLKVVNNFLHSMFFSKQLYV